MRSNGIRGRRLPLVPCLIGSIVKPLTAFSTDLGVLIPLITALADGCGDVL